MDWEPDFSVIGQSTVSLSASVRIPTPELGSWFLDVTLTGPPVAPVAPAAPAEPPPKRPRTEPPPLMPPPAPRPPPAPHRVPYDERPRVGPKPTDPHRPFRHAGLMRDIGGVEGYMKVVRGTHRLPEDGAGG